MALVGELATRSNEFRRWWGGHTPPVGTHAHKRKRNADIKRRKLQHGCCGTGLVIRRMNRPRPVACGQKVSRNREDTLSHTVATFLTGATQPTRLVGNERLGDDERWKL